MSFLALLMRERRKKKFNFISTTASIEHGKSRNNFPRLVTGGRERERESCQISPRSYTKFIVAINSNVAGKKREKGGGGERDECSSVPPLRGLDKKRRREVEDKFSRRRRETESVHVHTRTYIRARASISMCAECIFNTVILDRKTESDAHRWPFVYFKCRRNCLLESDCARARAPAS